MRLLPWLLLLVLLNPMAVFAGCAPEKMVKITFRDATPGIEETAKQPKTLFRFGSHHARLEEGPDREHGVHGLIVVNGRDTWMVNLAVKTGRHIVDRADSYDFHAPIIGSHDSPFVEFEFGCELAYMEARGIKPSPVTMGNQDLLQYEVSADGTVVRLLVDSKTGSPRAVEVVQQGRTVYLMRYDEYRTGLNPEMSLFTRPAGITYEAAE